MAQHPEFHPSGTRFDFSKYDNPYERARVAIIQDRIMLGHGRNALDIGCGPGYFSRYLTSQGWKTTSIDADHTNIENTLPFAVETHVGDAVCVLSNLSPQIYDLVLALEIIEHMPKDYGTMMLREIARVLKPGALLILSTPNRFSPEGLGAYYWGERIRGEGKWYAWDNTHVHIYSSWEIVRLLKKMGLPVDSVTGFHYEGRLPVIGRWELPFKQSEVFPLNYLGFNIVIQCHNSVVSGSSDCDRPQHQL